MKHAAIHTTHVLIEYCDITAVYGRNRLDDNYTRAHGTIIVAFNIVV